MNEEGLALLRALIFKMWSLNEARENGDCQAIADEINTWLPAGMEVTGYNVDRALRGAQVGVTVNVSLLRAEIDKMPQLFSARLNGDYQAILNEVRHRVPELLCATLADVVEAMALRPVPSPSGVIAASARLTGVARVG
jgi:hypothetical protein